MSFIIGNQKQFDKIKNRTDIHTLILRHYEPDGIIEFPNLKTIAYINGSGCRRAEFKIKSPKLETVVLNVGEHLIHFTHDIPKTVIFGQYGEWFTGSGAERLHLGDENTRTPIEKTKHCAHGYKFGYMINAANFDDWYSVPMYDSDIKCNIDNKKIILSNRLINSKNVEVLLLDGLYGNQKHVSCPNLKVLLIDYDTALDYIDAPKLEHAYCNGVGIMENTIRLKDKFPNLTLHIYEPHIPNALYDSDIPIEVINDEPMTEKGLLNWFSNIVFEYQLNNNDADASTCIIN